MLYVPIVHSEADLGSLAEAARSRFGPHAWARHQEEIQRYWLHVSQALTSVLPDPRGAKIYHDSLVADGPLALRMVEDMASRGSYGYRIVLDLVRRGAELVATEDLEMILAEYRLLQSPNPAPEQLSALLDRRDQFVAERISATLKPGETGVLFMGAAHKVHRFLPRDIQIVPVLNSAQKPRTDKE